MKLSFYHQQMPGRTETVAAEASYKTINPMGNANSHTITQ